MNLLIHVIVVLIVIGVVMYIVNQIPMPIWIANIIRAVAVLAVVLWLLQSFGLVGSYPLRLR